MQAISGMHSSLQTSVFSKVALSLYTIVPVLPVDMLPALVHRHVAAGKVDISGQLAPRPIAQPRDASANSNTETAPSSATSKLALAHILPVLASLSHVSMLDVSRNGILQHGDGEDVEPLAALIRTHSSSLSSLVLSDPAVGDRKLRDVGSAGGPMRMSRPSSPDTDVLWDALSRCAALTQLDLRDQRFHPSYRESSILKMLPQLSSLEKLDISGCFEYYKADMVLHSLPSLNCLTALALSDNGLFASSFSSLGVPGAIRRLPHLQSLDVSFNACRFHEYVAILAGFASMPASRSFHSESMHVESNGDTDTAAEALRARMDKFLTLGMRHEPPDATDLAHQDRRNAAPAAAEGAELGIVGHLAVLNIREFANTSKMAKAFLNFVHFNFEWQFDAQSDVVSVPVPESVNTWCLLHQLQGVHTLDFRGVPIGYGAEKDDCLARFVGGLRSLQKLDLSECTLPPSSLVRVCETLRKKTAEAEVVGITSLVWSSNQKFLAADVMGAVCGLKTLKSLVLRNCGLSMKQVRARQHFPTALPCDR